MCACPYQFFPSIFSFQIISMNKVSFMCTQNVILEVRGLEKSLAKSVSNSFKVGIVIVILTLAILNAEMKKKTNPNNFCLTCAVYLNNSVTKYLLNIHLSFKFKASEETAKPQHLQARLEHPVSLTVKAPRHLALSWTDRTEQKHFGSEREGESKRESLYSDSVTVKLRI